MWIKPATAEHNSTFTEWHLFDRLEEKTCRTVIDGKRIPPSYEHIIFAFFINGLEEPVGKFTYFDINPRNGSA